MNELIMQGNILAPYGYEEPEELDCTMDGLGEQNLIEKHGLPTKDMEEETQNDAK